MPVVFDDTEIPVFDAHTHLGRRAVPLGHGVSELLGDTKLEQMDAAGVDRSVVFPLGMPGGVYQEANDLIAAEAAKSGDRLIGYCRLNPNFGPEATEAELARCFGELGLRGIKLHPEIEFFDPNDRRLMEPVYEAARAHRAPIIFHTGMSSKAAPVVIAEVARAYPDVPVILGHMGVSEYAKQAISVAADYDNIFLETSVVGWLPLLVEAFTKLGPSKIVYGSDHPYNPFPMEISKLTVTVAEALGLDAAAMRAVLSGNMSQLLGLSVAVGSR